VHKLLARQLERTVGSTALSPQLVRLLELVEASYRQKEEDLAIAEGALEQTSQELIEHNRALRERTYELQHLLEDRERLLQRLRLSDRLVSIGTMAAGVAHEINNPLAFVGANLDLTHEWISGLPPMPGDKVRPEIDEALRDAREGVARIAAIVRDMKALSRSDEEHVGPVDIQSVLEGSIAIARNEIHHRAQVVRNFAPLPPVQGNAPRLGQVFLNLIVNAAHAIEAGNAAGNEIRVATSVTEGGAVRVDIEDTGQGIPEELRARIFEPFFTTKPIGEGTGLGLSICHGIVQSLGGSLECHSEVGKGSTFSVTLPASVMDAEPPPSRVESIACRRGRVLIVDDEASVAAALRRTLADDHEVCIETSGSAALQLLARDSTFDVILCDLMMPDTTGMDVFEALSAEHPSLCPRVVFMTGGVFTSRAIDFRDRVPNRFLDKPFDMGSVRALVSGFVR
jgi:signal transduction histidine kinase